MSRKSWVFIGLILALCTAGAASALPLEMEVTEAPGGMGLLEGLWDRLLDWIDRTAGMDDGLTVQEMEGCHLDPNGTCSS
jgi:hypothetical protein